MLKSRDKEVAGGSLNDRRLKSIEKGDFNWIGKGFLAVIKKECGFSKDHVNYPDLKDGACESKFLC